MKTLSLLLLAALLCGCIAPPKGRRIDPAHIALIKKGETTRQDVLAMMGQPDSVLADASGNTTFNYLFVAMKTGTSIHLEQLVIVFGPDNVVTNYISNFTPGDPSKPKTAKKL